MVCGLIVGGCTSGGESSATAEMTSTAPLVGLRDGDSRSVLVSLFCGADYLPIGVNDVTWRAEELDSDGQCWVVRMQSDRLIVTANGRSVGCRQMTPDDPANGCA